jgi:hypothetical protein
VPLSAFFWVQVFLPLFSVSAVLLGLSSLHLLRELLAPLRDLFPTPSPSAPFQFLPNSDM